MDWQEMAKKLMGRYDDTWTKAIANKRKAKSGQGSVGPPQEPAEPDDNDDDSGEENDGPDDDDTSPVKPAPSGTPEKNNGVDPWKEFEDSMDDKTKRQLLEELQLQR
jgi:hypothetical protein